MAFCPNLSDNEVAADFQAIIDKIEKNSRGNAEDIAYNLWNKFEGDYDKIMQEVDGRITTSLFQRWNVNQEGFTMSNTMDTASVEQMAKEAANIGLEIKKANTGAYYFTKRGRKVANTSQYFQIESEEKQEGPIKELQDRLIKWAELNNIDVIALESLIERMGEEGNMEGVVGVADIARKLIALAQDKIDISVLPEEVGHFIVDYMINDPSIIRALEIVNQTEIYEQVKEDYKDVYDNELDFRKEALGKILGQEIVSQFKAEGKGNIFQRIKTFLRAAKNKFIKKWKRQMNARDGQVMDELREIVEPLAAKALAVEEVVDTRTQEQIDEARQMFAKTKEEAKKRKKSPEEKFLENAINSMKGLIKKQRQSGLRSESGNRLKRQIDDLRVKIIRKQYEAGIDSFVEHTASEIESIENFINRKQAQIRNGFIQNIAEQDKRIVSFVYDFSDEYLNILEKFKEDIDGYALVVDAKKAETITYLDNAIATLRQIRGAATSVQKQLAVYALEQANLDENGDPINPNFDAKSIVEEAFADITPWRLGTGAYKNSNSDILKLAMKIINDKINRVDIAAKNEARRLLALQDKISDFKNKSKKLFEIDKEGKRTGYIVSKYNLGNYNAEMQKTRDKIAKELGYENYYDIIKSDLNAKDEKTYNRIWKEFFENHTKKVAQKTMLNGKEIMKIKTVPGDQYLNPVFDEIQSDPELFEYYEALLESKLNSLNKLPSEYVSTNSQYMIPQIRKSFLDRLMLDNKGGVLGAIKNFGRGFTDAILLEEEDTEFGERSEIGRNIIPIHYNKMLDDMNNLTYNLTGAYSQYFQMAENFREVNKISGEMDAIRNTLMTREYPGLGRETRSNEFKAVEEMMAQLMFGQTTVEKNTKVKIPMTDKEVTISWGKLMNNLRDYFSTNNLAFNFATAISGFFKGSLDGWLDGKARLYTTPESRLWAKGEMSLNSKSIMANIGKRDINNKLHLILEMTGVKDLDRMLKNTHRSRFGRNVFNRDIFYSPYMVTDYWLKGTNALAIFHNYRLFEGQFIKFNKFQQKMKEQGKSDSEIKSEWKALEDKNLYAALEVDGRKLVPKEEFKEYVNDQLLSTVVNSVNHLTHEIDGTISKEDRGTYSRTLFGGFVFMHRGWVTSGIDRKFKREGYNYETGEFEEGEYRSALKAMKKMGIASVLPVGWIESYAKTRVDKLTDVEKRNLYKTQLDFYMSMIIGPILAAILNLAADDDKEEDWKIQYMAYQANRIVLEMKSLWSPAEFLSILDEPVVATKATREIYELIDVLSNPADWDKKIEKGMYKDWSNISKLLFKRTPFKALYELQYPKNKNRFIKNTLNSRIYKSLKDEESFLRSFLPDELLSNVVGSTRSVLDWESGKDLDTMSDAEFEDKYIYED